jgi:hypothetical protein
VAISSIISETGELKVERTGGVNYNPLPSVVSTVEDGYGGRLRTVLKIVLHCEWICQRACV